MKGPGAITHLLDMLLAMHTDCRRIGKLDLDITLADGTTMMLAVTEAAERLRAGAPVAAPAVEPVPLPHPVLGGTDTLCAACGHWRCSDDRHCVGRTLPGGRPCVCTLDHATEAVAEPPPAP